MRLFFLEKPFSIFQQRALDECSDLSSNAAVNLAIVLWVVPYFEYVAIVTVALNDPSLFHYCLGGGLFLAEFAALGLNAWLSTGLSGGTCGDLSTDGVCDDCLLVFFVWFYMAAYEFTHCGTRRGAKNPASSKRADALETARAIMQHYTNADSSSTSPRKQLTQTMTQRVRRPEDFFSYVHPSRRTKVVILLLLAVFSSGAQVYLGIYTTVQVAAGAGLGVLWACIWSSFVFIDVTSKFHSPWVQRVLSWLHVDTFSFRWMDRIPIPKVPI